MNIQRISAQQNGGIQHQNFKAAYVTASQKNLGHRVMSVVDTYNSKILPEILKTQEQEANSVIKKAGMGKLIEKAADFINKVNFFMLGAGSGSRFRELAQTVGDYNKITLPFKFGEDRNIHMLDYAMAMGKLFTGKEGVQKIMATVPTGSFGDIVQHYLAGNPIKDTIVCCGDNVFGDSAAEIMEFFTEMMNNPNKHVALVGVSRPLESVLDTFGVLGVEGKLSDPSLKLTGFMEKPKSNKPEQVQRAVEMQLEGVNIANTGLFYLSKEVMEKLISEIQSGVNNISKNETEIYDFAAAVEYSHKMLPEWFGIESSEGANVKVVKKWEDVGEPKALYKFANDVKNGEYLHNFPKEVAEGIQASFKERVHVDDPEMPYIAFTESANPSKKQINDAKEVDGVKIVVD